VARPGQTGVAAGTDPGTRSEQPAVPPAGVADLAAAAPLLLRIPALNVEAAFVKLTVDRRGTLIPPADPARPGWYTGSAAPGELGPAVVAGHVDSKDGPAVFYRLSTLRAGAAIHVVRADGRVVRFRVVDVRRYAKADFPTQRVYGATPDRTLWLVTCGGPYVAGSYRDNVVVEALID
jgi:sortase (surface protein transpeptidase)